MEARTLLLAPHGGCGLTGWGDALGPYERIDF
jgi:hypothetical protein